MKEVEVRGKIDGKKFNRLKKILTLKGKLVDHYHRLSVDLSPGFDPRTRTWKNSSGTDIRLKKSDNKEKLTIKSGEFSDEVRREVEVKLESGQFLSALDFLECLGYKSGMIYYWESWEFLYDGCEVKLSKYTPTYYTFEIEGKENKKIKTMAKVLGLVIYTKEEYREVIGWENNNIHKIYSRKIVKKLLNQEYV